jgi:AN1-like Zinc finger
MNSCAVCGKPLSMVYRCKSCDKIFCINHRLPEEHNCENLQKVRKTKLLEVPKISSAADNSDQNSPSIADLAKHPDKLGLEGKKDNSAEDAELSDFIKELGKYGIPRNEEGFHSVMDKMSKIFQKHKNRFEIEIDKIMRELMRDPSEQKNQEELYREGFFRVIRDLENQAYHSHSALSSEKKSKIQHLEFRVKAYNNDMITPRATYIYLNGKQFKVIYWMDPNETMEDTIQIDPGYLNYEGENSLKALVSTYDRCGPKSWVSVVMEYQVEEKTERLPLFEKIECTSDRPPEVIFRITEDLKVEILKTIIKKYQADHSSYT